MTTPCERSYETSLLQRSKFTLTFSRLPAMSFFLKKCNLPGISSPNTTQNTAFIPFPVIGDQALFESFNCEFMIPSDLRPFIEIYNWIKGICRITGFKDYNKMKNLSQEHSAYSDAILTINSNLNTPKLRVLFYNVFPISLSGIQFNVESTADDILNCICEFKYAYYDIEII